MVRFKLKKTLIINYNSGKHFLILFTIVTPIFVCAQQEISSQIDYKAVTIESNDGIIVHGELYTKDKSISTVILFHQGGVNARGEYSTIIPKIIKEGFNILAIDQRIGGSAYYGGHNRTIANLEENNYTYCDAYPDLEAALDYLIAKNYTGNKILWGSSYSAALSIQLACKRTKDITALLAFSPSTGNAVKTCHPNPYLEFIKVPLLILRPKKEMERESSIEQFKIAEKYNHQTYIAEYGVHGSSMLVEERVEHDTTENWDVVLEFLNKYKD